MTEPFSSPNQAFNFLDEQIYVLAKETVFTYKVLYDTVNQKQHKLTEKNLKTWKKVGEALKGPDGSLYKCQIPWQIPDLDLKISRDRDPKLECNHLFREWKVQMVYEIGTLLGFEDNQLILKPEASESQSPLKHIVTAAQVRTEAAKVLELSVDLAMQENFANLLKKNSDWKDVYNALVLDNMVVRSLLVEDATSKATLSDYWERLTVVATKLTTVETRYRDLKKRNARRQQVNSLGSRHSTLRHLATATFSPRQAKIYANMVAPGVLA